MITAAFPSCFKHSADLPLKQKKVSALLQELEELYLGENFNTEKSLLVDIAVVTEQFSNRGIYQQLRHRSMFVLTNYINKRSQRFSTRTSISLDRDLLKISLNRHRLNWSWHHCQLLRLFAPVEAHAISACNMIDTLVTA